jgi:lipoprotein-anchoring transpeptidase ErfK/SrfK
LRFATLTTADLAAADLSGADLAHARLDRANLRAADLSKSCLDYANLDGANLSKLSLHGASLRFARLSAADLEAADLSGANLTHARLDQANLKAANLSHARLDYADFAGANFAKVNLRGANLQNAKNLTPSQLEKSIGDDSTILPPDLQGSVSWSRGAGQGGAAAFVYRDPPNAPNWVAKTSGLSFRSYPRLAVVAVVIVIAALAIAVGWQHMTMSISLPPLSEIGTTSKPPWLTQDFSDRISLPSAPGGPQAAKPVEAPALSAQTTDRMDGTLLEQRGALETLAPTPVMLPMLAEISPSSSSHPIEITELHEVPAEVRVISARESGGVVELHAPGGQGRDVRSLVPASMSPHVTPTSAPSDAEILHPLPAPFATLASDIPVVRLLAPSVSLLGEARQPPVAGLLPFSAKKGDVLTALPPSSKIVLTSVRVQAAPRETRWQSSSARARGDPLMLSVSLDRQMIDVFRGTALVMSSKVSSGMPGHETKPGVFSILEKQRFHHSNIYSGAPMPWMQRLTRSGTALHAGMVPGYPASHGCVRLPFAFAPKLFQMTAVGETVLIASERLTPKPIEHPKLFQPRPRPVALAMAESAQIPWRLADGAEESPAGTAILPLVIAHDAEAPPEAAESVSSDNGDALAPAPLRILVTRSTPRDQLIGVQYTLSSMGFLTRQNFDGTFGKATVAAIRAFRTANGLIETGALDGDLVKKIYEVAGKPEPPEGHLFVRQGFARVFDVAIAFRQPSQPLGTHVYTALNFAAGDTKVRWGSFNLEGGDSASVLDRLEIPEDVRRTISEMLTPGSSLIVADTSVDSAILPEGDDFLVWAKEPEANEPSAKEPAMKVQSSNIKQANIEPVKPKRAARVRATASPRESWPRPARRYTANRPPRFEPPRWFSPW